MSAAAEQKAPAACAAGPVVPPGWSGWAEAVPMAALRAEDVEAPAIPSARRVTLSLHRATRLAYPVPPESAIIPDQWGGMVPVSVEGAGRLVIALGGRAWIDLVRDGKLVPSSGHGHGPACSGIRKMVEFDVTPGRYLLQISNSSDVSMDAMAVLRD